MSAKREADYAPASPDVVLDKAGVARWFKVHPRTIQRLVHTKGLPTLGLTERQPRFLVRDVLRWLEEQGRAA